MEIGPWWVEKKILHGGKQEGSELIVVNNGKLEFAVSPTRGMNVDLLKTCRGGRVSHRLEISQYSKWFIPSLLT